MNDDAEPKDSVNDTAKAEDAPAALPEIPKSAFDFDLSPFIEPNVEDRVRKRASNILKLTEENERLKAELKAVTDRLEAAERRREELARKKQPEMIEERSP